MTISSVDNTSGAQSPFSTLPAIHLTRLAFERKNQGLLAPRKVSRAETATMVFCRTGGVGCKIQGNRRLSAISLVAGQYVFYRCDCGCDHHCEHALENGTQVVQLQYRWTDLKFFLDDHPFSFGFSRLMENRIRVLPIRPIPAAINPIIDQLSEYDETSRHGDLFVAAKALELLYHFLHTDPATDDGWLHAGDRQAIQKAKDILESRMHAPPTLRQLASQVGMSASKFKQLFPRVCGSPPYTYLREIRMEKAMEMIHQGQYNITEVAMAVGYSSISHFTKTFADRFGMKPSQIRRYRRSDQRQIVLNR